MAVWPAMCCAYPPHALVDAINRSAWLYWEPEGEAGRSVCTGSATHVQSPLWRSFNEKWLGGVGPSLAGVSGPGLENFGGDGLILRLAVHGLLRGSAMGFLG